MKYTSTRDTGINVSAAEAIVCGLAPGGGLFVPESFPKISIAELSQMANLSYEKRANRILAAFLTDFTPEEICEATEAAYNRKNFETESIAPVYRLSDKLYVLELWHGPTCAFKDMALQILPYLITKSLKKVGSDKTLAVLTATSGDTGKAALEGFRDVPGTKIVVFYPRDGVSNMQKLQMITQEGENVAVFAVEGNFDDAQNGVKAIFSDKALGQELEKRGILLSSANSINWGRLVPQIAYYFSAYCDLLRNGEIKEGESINFVVPTGNFGNILAAYYSKLMGLPVGRLICASNKNNVLTDFIESGVYNRNRTFYATESPSMDILISSNLERFLFHMAGGDSAAVSSYMRELAEKGAYEVSPEIKEKMARVLWGGYCDDENTLKTIRSTQEKYDYILDPHTAVGMNVYEQYKSATGDETKTVIASTASPFKFSGAVYSALRDNGEATDEFEVFNKLNEDFGLRVPPPLASLKEKTVRFKESVKKENMRDLIKGMLLG